MGNNTKPGFKLCRRQHIMMRFLSPPPPRYVELSCQDKHAKCIMQVSSWWARMHRDAAGKNKYLVRPPMKRSGRDFPNTPLGLRTKNQSSDTHAVDHSVDPVIVFGRRHYLTEGGRGEGGQTEFSATWLVSPYLLVLHSPSTVPMTTVCGNCTSMRAYSVELCQTRHARR